MLCLQCTTDSFPLMPCQVPSKGKGKAGAGVITKQPRKVVVVCITRFGLDPHKIYMNIRWIKRYSLHLGSFKYYKWQISGERWWENWQKAAGEWVVMDLVAREVHHLQSKWWFHKGHHKAAVDTQLPHCSIYCMYFYPQCTFWKSLAPWFGWACSICIYYGVPHQQIDIQWYSQLFRN